MKKSAILALSLVLVAQQSFTSLTAAQANAVLNRNAIDPSIPQKSPLVKCLSQQQLDCVEKVAVEHPDGSFEEAKFVSTRIVDFPNENGQKVQYGDLLFDFRNENKNGSIKRLRLSTHVISPTGTFNGKKAGAYWIVLQRELMPNEPPQQSKEGICSEKTPLQCANYPALDTNDVFHVYLPTSWLSPVSASGAGKKFNIDYRKISGGYQWKLSGGEFLQPMFSDSSKLAESVKPGNENMIPDRLNPTLYFALDHGGKDLSDSYWDPSCMSKGFTRTMWNAPLAGQLFWDYGSQTLNFNMYAPHSDPFGNDYLGVFRTRFQKAWLDCRFPGNNLSTASEITVQVLNENGTPQVATTAVTMKDGIIDISASGFHFSSPKIVAKKALNSGTTNFSNENLKDDWTEISPPASSTKVQKKSVIVCMKGKTSKQISGVNPKCPSGFKSK